jgi:hypothetical protein
MKRVFPALRASTNASIAPPGAKKSERQTHAKGTPFDSSHEIQRFFETYS